jgi:phasin family protein
MLRCSIDSFNHLREYIIMQKEVWENWNGFWQQSLENMKKIGEANLKLSEKLWQEQIAMADAMFENVQQSTEELSKVKDVQQAAALQAELAQEYGKQVVESCRSCADVLAEAGKTYNQIFEKGVWTGDVAGKAAGKRKAA